MRRRAAEAASWLGALPFEGPVTDLASDPEPDVRETFARCQRERKERDWAAAYLQCVLEVRTEDSLLKNWRYGRALERTGDDSTLERLDEHRRLPDLPAGIRYWLGRLVKKLRTRWDEVTRKWPEPWFARRGSLEEAEGAIAETVAAKAAFHCWLWQLPASELTGVSSWGGWCPQAVLPIGLLTLRLVGRRSATILVTQAISPDGPTYFVGSGPYPDREGREQPPGGAT
jgi:hypothetical protein